MTRDFDHKKWLSFLQKAAALPMDFSESDLVWLERVASVQFPSLVPLISACLTLARGQVVAEPSSVESSTTTRPDSERTFKLRAIQNLLESKSLFPNNFQLIAFAKERLAALPDYKFDKMSRERITKMMVDIVAQAPPRVRDELLAELQRVDNGQEQSRASFLKDWEHTIKTS